MKTRSLSVLAVVPVVLLLLPATAIGQQDTGADNKANPYGNNAESRAGICLEVPVIGPVEVSCAKSSSSTSDESGASSQSEATPFQILGVAVNEKMCEATGLDQQGVVREEMPFTFDPGLQLLDSRCKASAVQQNTAASEAETVLLSFSQSGVVLDVARSEADNRSTSGQAHSGAEFVLVAADVDGVGGVALLQCRSKTNANRGHPDGKTQTSGTLIDLDGNRVEDPGLCPFFVSSEANSTT